MGLKLTFVGLILIPLSFGQGITVTQSRKIVKFSASGAPVSEVSASMIVALAADGRISATEPDFSLLPERPGTYRRITVPNRKVTQLLFFEDKAKSTFFDDVPRPGLLNKKNHCTVSRNQVVVVDTDPLHGVRAVHTRERLVLGDSRVEIDRWNLPDYACLQAQYSAESFDNEGNLVSELSEAAVAVALGEPSAELFDIPANLVEMSPREVQIGRYKRKFGAEWKEHVPAAFLKELQQPDSYLDLHQKALDTR